MTDSAIDRFRIWLADLIDPRPIRPEPEGWDLQPGSAEWHRERAREHDERDHYLGVFAHEVAAARREIDGAMEKFL